MTDDVVLDPMDTTRIRKLLAPIMRRNEKHTLLGACPAEDAFLHSLITEGIIPILDELNAFAGPYREAQALAVGGSTTVLRPPDLPPAATYNRPEHLAVLEPNLFQREVHLLPIEELERLATPGGEGDVDMFSVEQRLVLAEILDGRRTSTTFEIQCTDPIPKPGDVVEYDGRAVVMLGLSETEDQMRVAYVDTELRRDDASSTDPQTRTDTPAAAAADDEQLEDIMCTDCEHIPFATDAALKRHRTMNHPFAPTPI